MLGYNTRYFNTITAYGGMYSENIFLGSREVTALIVTYILFIVIM